MADHLEVTSGLSGTDDPVSGLRVSLLGPMQVEHDGRAVHVAGPQRRRLLALLACRAGAAVPVEALVDAMWGENPPPSAAKTIQSHVVRLRQSLFEAGEPIETAPGGYRLAVGSEAVDIARFERLADEGATELRLGHFAASAQPLSDALALWRGPALMEFAGEEFAVGYATRLGERRLAAVEDLAEARLGTGAASVVVPEMERLVAEHAGRERAWALLMRALYSTGRQHDALVAYQRARTVLADEYGLDPGPELRQLEQRIIEHDPALLVPRDRAALPAALRDETPLVGRRNELAWLQAAWRQACSGVGQVRALLGASGSGRTRLAGELALTAISDGGAVEYVSGATGLHLLAGPGGSGGPGAIIDTIGDRCRNTPLLLVVDEVQWSPPASIDAINALATAAERLMLCIVLIGDDGDGPGISMVRNLERQGTSTLELPPMPDAELSQLLDVHDVDRDAVDVAVAMAGGLPGTALREAAAWAERSATERLDAATSISIDARSVADVAGASVLDEVLRLVEARRRQAALSAADWTGRQPYRSLASYEAADADLFVGRERLVAELTSRVLDRRLVAVVGASGSGKSSIVRAGLLPLVRSGRLPGGGAWRTAVIVPGRDPMAALEAVAGLDDPGPQLVVIDQFEEVLSTGQTDLLAARLLDLVLDPALDARIVLVVRADQVGGLANSRALAEMIEDSQVLVGPPSEEELIRIVTEPARRTGCTVEPALVALIGADVAGHDAALPLVSAAMAEVWERRDGDTLRADTYTEIGGLAAAVERLGDRALTAVGAAGRGELRDVMLRLVDVTDDGSWVRRRVDLADMPASSTRVIDALVDARLVARADGTLDVVHEVVFRAWPQMVEWLEEARADIVLERDLRAAARSWDTEGRSDDDVLRGGRLHAASDWAARCDHVPPVVAELIAASRDFAERDDRAIRDQLEREQRGRRRLRALLAVASVLLIVAAIGGALAVENSRQAQRQRRRADAAAIEAAQAATEAASAAELADDERRRAETNGELAEQRRADAQTARLAAESESNLDRDLALAMLLAVEAHRSGDTPETRGALLSALTHNVTSVRAAQAPCCDDPRIPTINSAFAGFVPGPTRHTQSMSASHDGRIVATAGSPTRAGAGGGEVLVFDTVDRELLLSQVTVGTVAPSVSPDGGSVLIPNGPVMLVYDTATMQVTELSLTPPVGASFAGATYTPDGSRYLVAATDGTLSVVDAALHTSLDVPLPKSPGLAGVAPDGTLALGRQNDPIVRYYDLTTGEETRTLTLEPTSYNLHLFAFSPDMRYLAASEPQGAVVVWDLADGTLVGDPAGRPHLSRAITFDPSSSTTLVIGSADGGVWMYDVEGDHIVGEPQRALVGGVRALTFSGDGSLLITTSDDGTLALWSESDGPTLLSQPIGDGERLLGVSESGEVVVLGGTVYAKVHRPGSAPEDPVDIRLAGLLSAAVGRDRATLWRLSAGGSAVFAAVVVAGVTTHMFVFDSRTGELLWSHDDPRHVYGPEISGDGRLVAVPIDDELIEIWDVGTGEKIAEFAVDDVLPGGGGYISGEPTFSADNRTLTFTSNVAVIRVDIATGRATHADPAGGLQGRVAQVPGSEDVVASGMGGRVWRWDLADGGVVASGRSRDGSSLGSVAVSGDGRLVAAAHPFTSGIALFDGETLEPIGDPIPTGDVGEWSTFALSADGLRLYANNPVNEATVWNLDVTTWDEIACRAAGRNMTRAEFADHIGDDVDYRATCPEWPLEA